jgi:hypothetical protein
VEPERRAPYKKVTHLFAYHSKITGVIMPTLFNNINPFTRYEEYCAALEAGNKLVVVRTTEEPKITKPTILVSRQIALCRN